MRVLRLKIPYPNNPYFKNLKGTIKEEHLSIMVFHILQIESINKFNPGIAFRTLKYLQRGPQMGNRLLLILDMCHAV